MSNEIIKRYKELYKTLSYKPTPPIDRIAQKEIICNGINCLGKTIKKGNNFFCYTNKKTGNDFIMCNLCYWEYKIYKKDFKMEKYQDIINKLSFNELNKMIEIKKTCEEKRLIDGINKDLTVIDTKIDKMKKRYIRIKEIFAKKNPTDNKIDIEDYIKKIKNKFNDII